MAIPVKDDIAVAIRAISFDLQAFQTRKDLTVRMVSLGTSRGDHRVLRINRLQKRLS